MSGPGFIAEEAPQQCTQCGAFEETRPYGPNSSRVCFTCAMKDPEGTERRFAAQVLGIRVPKKPVAEA